MCCHGEPAACLPTGQRCDGRGWRGSCGCSACRTPRSSWSLSRTRLHACLSPAGAWSGTRTRGRRTAVIWGARKGERSALTPTEPGSATAVQHAPGSARGTLCRHSVGLARTVGRVQSCVAVQVADSRCRPEWAIRAVQPRRRKGRTSMVLKGLWRRDVWLDDTPMAPQTQARKDHRSCT